MAANRSDVLLRYLRANFDTLSQTIDDGRFDVPVSAKAALSVFRALDEHLSGGGTPPEVWREGPDAVPTPDDARDSLGDQCGACGRPANEVNDHVVDGTVYHEECIPDEPDREPNTYWKDAPSFTTDEPRPAGERM